MNRGRRRRHHASRQSDQYRGIVRTASRDWTRTLTADDPSQTRRLWQGSRTIQAWRVRRVPEPGCPDRPDRARRPRPCTASAQAHRPASSSDPASKPSSARSRSLIANVINSCAEDQSNLDSRVSASLTDTRSSTTSQSASTLLVLDVMGSSCPSCERWSRGRDGRLGVGRLLTPRNPKREP